MKSVFLLLSMLIAGNVLWAQHVYTIRADSVKLFGHDSAELVIGNHTQGIPGFLFNTDNGRTIFKRVLVQLDDSTYLLGVDTLRAKRSAYWKAVGNNIVNQNAGNVGIHRSSPNAMLDLPGSISMDDTSAYRINNHPVLRLGALIDTDYNSYEYVGSYTNLHAGDSAGTNNTGTYVTHIGNGAGVNSNGNNNALLGYGSGHDNVGDANTFMGYLSGQNNSVDSSGNPSGYNTFLGIQSGQGNTGSGNTFLGDNAGHDNYGSYNTYTGEQAGYNGYGNNNVFAGQACGYNSSGDNNTFSGYNTAMYNTGNGNLIMSAIVLSFQSVGYSNRGDNNIMLCNSGGYNNRGRGNIILGDNVGTNNPSNGSIILGNSAGFVAEFSSDSNIFIGFQSGNYNNGGFLNTCIGSQTGYGNYDSSSENTFIGSGAGTWNEGGYPTNTYTKAGKRNTFVGKQAGGDSQVSDGNTFLGNWACRQNGYGVENVCIGDSSGVNGFIGNYNVMAGALSGYQGDETGSYNTLLGAETDLEGSLETNYNIFLGGQAGADGEEDGNYNTFLGGQSCYYCNVSTGVTLAGGQTNAAYQNNDIGDATAIGYKAVVNTSNTMVFGDTATKTWLLGIYSLAGSPTPGAALVVGSNSSNGNGAYLSIGGSWTNASDRLKKENFETLNSTAMLEKIAALPISRWKYKGVPAQHIGPVAQDFYRIFHVGEDNKTISTIDPSGISLLGVQGLYHQYKEAVQHDKDQQNQIHQQESQIYGQQEQLTRLRAGMEQQKGQIENQREQMRQLLEKLNKMEGSLGNDK